MRESASGTFIWAPGDPAIIDERDNSYELSRRGQVVINGIPDPATSNVIAMAYLNRRVWQWNNQRLWWSKTGLTAAWLPPEGQPEAPFGPMPDVRIDTLIGLFGSMKSEQMRIFGLLSGSIQGLQQDIDQIPQRIPPDPRIDQLLSGQASIARDNAASLKTLTVSLDSMVGMMQAWQADVLTRLDLIDAQVSNQSKMDGLTAQLNRVVQMLLDLFPHPPPRPAIKANLRGGTSEGTQAAPSPSGP